jgi:hypothetical protein
LGTYLAQVQEVLGLDPLDYRFLGYLAIGTPASAVSPAERPDFRQFVTEWRGVSAEGAPHLSPVA